MNKRCSAVWLWVAILGCVATAAADDPPKQTPGAVETVETSDQLRPDAREQLAELSRQVENLVKQSQQQQRMSQYQLVAMAAISLLLVMLLVSGTLRRRETGPSE